MTRTLLVIPTYNEEHRLPVDDIATYLNAAESKDADLLFVDDGSLDRTPEILRDLTDRFERISILTLETNLGKAEAVRRGMLHAFAKDYAFAGYWDADLATPLSEVAAMIRALQDTNVVLAMGSRVKLLGRQIERKAYRHYLGRIFATLVSLSLDLGVYDTQCGAKIFRMTREVKRIFDQPFHSRWIFDVELLARLKDIGMKLESSIVEVPLQTWVDVSGSKLKPRDFITAVWELAQIHGSYRVASGNSRSRTGSLPAK